MDASALLCYPWLMWELQTALCSVGIGTTEEAHLVINTAQLLEPPAEGVLQVPLPVQQGVVQADPGCAVPADGKLLDALRQAREFSQPRWARHAAAHLSRRIGVLHSAVTTARRLWLLLHAEGFAVTPVSRWLQTYLQPALTDLAVLQKPLLRLSSVLLCVSCITVISFPAIILQPVRSVRSLVVALCQLPAGPRASCLPAGQGQGNDLKGKCLSWDARGLIP